MSSAGYSGYIREDGCVFGSNVDVSSWYMVRSEWYKRRHSSEHWQDYSLRLVSRSGNCDFCSLLLTDSVQFGRLRSGKACF